MRLLLSSTPPSLASFLPDFAPWLGTLVTPSNGTLAQAKRLWDQHRIPWAADNECFKGLDPESYRAMLEKISGWAGCMWVTVPDMVGNAFGTLHLWHQWAQAVEDACHQPLALVGQDGMEDREIPWGEFDALFIGGSTEWKESRAASSLVGEALRRGKRIHMGRVNSYRRYRIAQDMGCHSVDGTRVCRWTDEWLPTSLRFLRHMDSEKTMFPVDAS